jgi:signal transduction histidine kinase
MNQVALNGDNSRLQRAVPGSTALDKSVPETKENRETLEFTYTLAHEIRNPLTTINLAVDMLRISDDPKEKEACLDLIIRNSLRINGLLTDLLNSYQVNEIRLEIYAINLLIDEVVDRLQDRLSLKNIEVSKYYSTQDCKLLLNKEKIKIALTNIILNAIEAMTEGKGKLKIFTKWINGKCIVEIQDNGSGISIQNLKKIFTPYFTTKPGGMGLGLSSSLDILRANHFHVDVQSAEKSGTRFILSIDSPSWNEDNEPMNK